MKIKDSPRLRIAPITQDDAALLFELDQDPQVMKYINGGRASTLEDIHAISLPRLASYQNVEKGWGQWKVFIKDKGTFIGWILTRPMDFFSDTPKWDTLEIGWRFKREAWGKGYATEAALCVIEAIKEQKLATALCAVADPDNQGSIKIMQKLGMRYVKTYTHKDPMGDTHAVYYEKDL